MPAVIERIKQAFTTREREHADAEKAATVAYRALVVDVANDVNVQQARVDQVLEAASKTLLNLESDIDFIHTEWQCRALLDDKARLAELESKQAELRTEYAEATARRDAARHAARQAAEPVAIAEALKTALARADANYQAETALLSAQSAKLQPEVTEIATARRWLAEHVGTPPDPAVVRQHAERTDERQRVYSELTAVRSELHGDGSPLEGVEGAVRQFERQLETTNAAGGQFAQRIREDLDKMRARQDALAERESKFASDLAAIDQQLVALRPQLEVVIE